MEVEWILVILHGPYAHPVCIATLVAIVKEFGSFNLSLGFVLL